MPNLHWTYGVELWGIASQSNVEILQIIAAFDINQNKVLKSIENAP